MYYHIHTVGEHLQRIAPKPSIHESSHNITLYTFVRGITVFPRTHFGSRPNRTPSFCAHNSVLARTEHPEAFTYTHFGSPKPNTQSCPQGSQESPLQAGLSPGNSLLDYPVFPADIGTLRSGWPARTGVPLW